MWLWCGLASFLLLACVNIFIQYVLSGLMAGRSVSLGDFDFGCSCHAFFFFYVWPVAAPPKVHDADGVTARILAGCLWFCFCQSFLGSLLRLMFSLFVQCCRAFVVSAFLCFFWRWLRTYVQIPFYTLIWCFSLVSVFRFWHEFQANLSMKYPQIPLGLRGRG